MEFKESETVSIIGTGNYGIALGKRLMKYGLNVIYGSRTPNMRYLNECFSGYEYTQGKYSVTRPGESFYSADLFVFLAIDADAYESFVSEINKFKNEQQLKNRPLSKEVILVELSNSSEPGQAVSNAEKLAKLIGYNLNFDSLRVNLIKGFNLVDAYSISFESGEKGSNELIVPICGDDLKSKEILSKLCSRLNIKTNDIGKLEHNALYLEKLNKETFIEWQMPSFICILYFIINFIWMFFHYYMFPKKPIESFHKYLLKTSLLELANKVLGLSALQLLAFVYLSSALAAIFQLAYKTKYRRFPNWLDFILRSRKQFGLWAFLYATLHLVCSVIIADPGYLSGWYEKARISLNSDGSYKFDFPKLTLHGELNFLTGILAYITMLLVALTSINSIADSLNWNEWRFVQTKLGLVCLFLGMTHTLVMYSKTIFQRNELTLLVILTRFKLLAAVIPFLTLLLRFLFAYFPPLSKRIDSIRKGKLLKGDSTIGKAGEVLPLTN